MIYTMAIDPGGTTGLAFRMPDLSVQTCKAQTQEQVWDYFIDIKPPDQVVLEEWQYFDGKVTPAGNFTADLCASIIGICYIMKIPLALRSPASRQPFQQQAEEWYRRQNHIKTVQKIHSHECDALAHLLTWEYMHPELRRQVNATSRPRSV
jgi:hypothetical protein